MKRASVEYRIGIRQPSIAAENRGMSEGCDMMMRLLRDAGFDT
jgi:hypothetical protein